MTLFDKDLTVMLCKSSFLMLISLQLHEKSREVCIKARSPSSSLAVIGQVTKYTTVKWSIEPEVNAKQGSFGSSD